MSWVRPDNFIPYDTPWYAQGYSKYNGSCNGTSSIEVNGVTKIIPGGRPGARILDNCAGFANGAYNETFYENMKLKIPNLEKKQYFRFTCNANLFYTKRALSKSLHPAFTESLVDFEVFKNTCLLTPDLIPPEGGIICWGGDANHAAYIEKVVNENEIIIQQSGYRTPLWTTEDKSRGGYYVNRKHIYRDYKDRKNIWWFNNNGNKLTAGKYCQGFIANPAIDVKCDAVPTIEYIRQQSPTEVCIKGSINSQQHNVAYSRIFYKWNGNVVVGESNNYDNVINIPNNDFLITLDKPRSANYISVIVINYGNDNDECRGEIVTSALIESYPSISLIGQDGIKKDTIPYVYTNNKWNEAIPTLYIDKSWHEIYNTDTKRVK